MEEYILQQAAAYARDCREEQRALLCTLARLPAPTGAEEARAVFCRDWLHAQGMPQARIDEAGNVVCLLGDPDARDLAVFAAHTDVVFDDRTPLPLREEGGRLWAPGIGDDTANLVNLLLAGRYLARHRPALPWGVLLVADTGEEGLGNLRGTRAVFDAWGDRIRAFYSFDLYLPTCCCTAVGSYRYRVTCTTRGGHSYHDFGAPSAIHLLCGLVTDLCALQPPAGTTYNVGRIEGGTTVNAIAQQAEMLYEFRATDQPSLEAMDALFHRTLDRWRDKGGTLTAERLGVRPGNGPVDAGALARFTAHSAALIRACTGREADTAPASTDSNIPLSRGIVANTIGTVTGGGLHTRQEWIDPESLPTGLQLALALMLDPPAL